jgi:N utilization substance protein A
VRATQPGERQGSLHRRARPARAGRHRRAPRREDRHRRLERRPATFVANALFARVEGASAFVVDESLKAVRALVPDSSSLAIGKEGQNARLAAKLTGARIDIQPDSVMES